MWMVHGGCLCGDGDVGVGVAAAVWGGGAGGWGWGGCGTKDKYHHHMLVSVPDRTLQEVADSSRVATLQLDELEARVKEYFFAHHERLSADAHTYNYVSAGREKVQRDPMGGAMTAMWRAALSDAAFMPHTVPDAQEPLWHRVDCARRAGLHNTETTTKQYTTSVVCWYSK